MLVLAIFIIAFFLFFGCAFEFCSYYLNYKSEDEASPDIEVVEIGRGEYLEIHHNKRDISENNHLDYQKNQQMQNQNLRMKKEAEEEDEGCTCKKVIICFFLIVLGIFLQPVYLLFYILLGMMECYRRFACWYFYF